MRLLQKYIIRLLFLLTLSFVLPQAYGKSNDNSYIEKKEELKRAHPYSLPVESGNEKDKTNSDTSKAILNLLNTIQNTFVYFIFFILVVAILGYVLTYYTQWKRNTKKALYMDNEDIDINQTFTNEEINNLLTAGNFKDAIKIVYIQTIQLLNKKKVIQWAPYKTPIDFYYEVKNNDIKKDLMNLTTITLAVRYGNTVATKEDFDKSSNIYENLKKELL